MNILTEQLSSHDLEFEQPESKVFILMMILLLHFKYNNYE